MSASKCEERAVYLVGIGGRYHLFSKMSENCAENGAVLSLGGVGCQDTAVRLWRALEVRSREANYG